MFDIECYTPNYIICVYAEKGSTRGYEIHGPFPDEDALAAYGKRWQAENGDNPSWQSLYLADPHAAPKVVKP